MHAASERSRQKNSAPPEQERQKPAARAHEATGQSPAWAVATGEALPSGLLGSAAQSLVSSAQGNASTISAAQAASADRPAAAVTPPALPPFPRPAAPVRTTGLFVQRAAAAPGDGFAPTAEPITGTASGEQEDMSSAPPGLLVEDDAAPGPNQMGKSEFMAALREEVCRTVDEVLAGTPYSAHGCPYVEFWLGFYVDRDAAHIERALNRYAPDTRSAASAQEYITRTSERVRRATEVWRDTGRVTDVPEGIPANSAAPPIPPPGEQTGGGSASPVAATPVNGASAASASPRALRQQLGRGSPLDGSVRNRLEPALGADLSHVRVHTDTGAAGLSQSLRARAFTVGEHIAFGTGQYRPGTPVGDALLAHELAHTIQQNAGNAPESLSAGGAASMGGARYRSLEEDANRSAAGVLRSLWADARTAAVDIGRQALPRLRSGLRLQGCKDSEKEPAEKTPSDAGPKPTQPDAGPTREQAEAALVAHVKTTLADNKIEPVEWAGIGNRVRELKLDDRDLRSRLSFDLDFERPWDEVTALLALDNNATIKTFASTFTTTTTGAPVRFMTDPLPPLVAQTLTDATIDLTEFDALRKFASIYSADMVRAALSGQNVTEPTLGSLMSMLDLGYSNYEALKKQSGVFPIKLQKDKSDTFLSATSDLRLSVLTVITADDAWQHFDFKIVRSILGGMKRADAIAYLVTFGLEQASADLLGSAFTLPAAAYKVQVEDRSALDVLFRRTQAGLEMTPQSRATWQAPWHPTLIAPLAPVGGKTVTSKLEQEENIGKYKFASGQEKQAGRITMTFRGVTIKVVMAEELYQDASLFDRVDAALSVVPLPHLKYLTELVLDPGNDPGGSAIANASRSGTVNMFFSGAGPHIAQASLNETTAHEVGHLVSFQAEKLDAKFWDKWKQAIKNDGIAVSRYGTTNELEDFAESYVLYLSGGGADAATRIRFKNRWALLDPIFK